MSGDSLGIQGPDVSSLLISAFPAVDMAFAYGSGAVRQGGYKYNSSEYNGSVELPMLDLIFAVEDSEAWHKANMKRHRDHYTSMIDLNASQIAKVQKRIGAGVWFNAMVPIPIANNDTGTSNRLLKYGVIETFDLQKDLTTWETLYVAGRLHKPVQLIKSSGQLDVCMEINSDYAIYTALSLLPSRFTEQDLYMKIASLSYTGDPRMLIGENPHKVRNLVEPILPAYRKLYDSHLRNVDSHLLRSAEVSGGRSFAMDPSLGAKKYIQSRLPSSIRSILPRHSEMGTLSEEVRSAVSTVVGRSATAQTAKGLFTIGTTKSLVYAAQKVAKRFA